MIAWYLSGCFFIRLLLSLDPLGLLQLLPLLLGIPPYLFGMFKGPQLNTLTNLYFINAIQFQIRINNVKQIELISSDEGILGEDYLF